MPTSAKKTAKRKPNAPAARPTLRAIPGGKSSERAGARGARSSAATPIDDLLSGKVTRTTEARGRKKGQVAPQELPKNVSAIANLFAAGRTIDKEMRFKLDYAKQKLEDFCLSDWISKFVATRKRPSSIDYSANHSRFKFVMTSRTTLTQEKVDELKDLGLPIDEHTVLRGLQVNYDAIRQHGLEGKLREALASLNVKKGVLEEIFSPRVELKETFYDLLAEIVRQSLKSGEKMEEKMLTVLEVLDPTNQMRNVEVLDLSVDECFKLIEKTEIEPDEEIA